MSYIGGDTCPICGQGLLKKRIFNEKIYYKEYPIYIKNFCSFFCNKCKEEIISEKTVSEIEKKIDELVSKGY